MDIWGKDIDYVSMANWLFYVFTTVFLLSSKAQNFANHHHGVCWSGDAWKHIKLFL